MEMSGYFQDKTFTDGVQETGRRQVQGLAIGVDVGDPDYASQLVDKCRRAGLLVTDEDETLTLFPALNIDLKVALEGLDILEDCL
jgi:4-aminobutyrate aminotransferase-like enzyme